MEILVSFSLYGTDLKYLHGAIRNAQIIEELGNGWKSVFYLGHDVPNWVAEELKSHHALIREWQDNWHANGMFWRFYAVREFDFDYLLVRDVDSRVSDRELSFIQTWVDSGKVLHVIRDHPHHGAVILGGLWGGSSKIKTVEIDWDKSLDYGVERGSDQDFLRDEVWPKLKHSVCELGSSFITSIFVKWVPRRSAQDGFVGEAFDQFGAPEQFLRQELDSRPDSILKIIRRSIRLARIKHFGISKRVQ